MGGATFPGGRTGVRPDRVRQAHLHGHRIDRLDGVELPPEPSESAGAGRLTSQCRHDILGIECCAVVEGDALPQGEPPGAVVHLLPFRRQPPCRLTVPELDEGIEDLACGQDRVAQHRVRPMRIDVRDGGRRGRRQEQWNAEKPPHGFGSR